MRALVVLLVLSAAVGGFLLGRLSAPEVRGRGGERGAARPVAEPREPAPAPDAPAAAVPEASPATDVVPPTSAIEHLEDDQFGLIDGPSEWGIIEIEFGEGDGEPQAWAGWRTIRGGYETSEIVSEEGERVARAHLTPGIYDVWWLRSDGRRGGTRAAVENRKLTRLKAAEYRGSGPVPEGLGILDLEVMATWGAGLGCDVHIIHGEEETAIETNGSGHASEALFPGRYVLAIGDHREEVSIAAGQETTRRIAHGKEGDLILDLGNELPPGVGIARPGEPLQQPDLWTGLVDGTRRCGLVYVQEGEYDVFYIRDVLDGLGVPLGRAVVHGGRTTVLRGRLPPGGLALRVLVPESTRSRVAVAIGRVAEAGTGQMTLYADDDALEARFTVILAPGRYAVTASAGGCEPKSVEIDVADRVVELTLDLSRLR